MEFEWGPGERKTRDLVSSAKRNTEVYKFRRPEVALIMPRYKKGNAKNKSGMLRLMGPVGDFEATM